MDTKRIKGRPTAKNYPNFISDSAKPIWEAVVLKGGSEINKFKDPVLQWRAAIYLFRRNCDKFRIIPFLPDGNLSKEDDVSQALFMLNKNFIHARDLLDVIAEDAKEAGIVKTFSSRDANVTVSDDARNRRIHLTRKVTLASNTSFGEFQSLLTRNWSFRREHGKSTKIENHTLNFEVEQDPNRSDTVWVTTTFLLKPKQAEKLSNGKSLSTWVKKWKGSRKVIAVINAPPDYVPGSELIVDVPVVEPKDVVKIESKNDVWKAQRIWNSGVLIPLDTETRTEFARILVEKSKQFDEKPLPVWESMLADPDHFDELRDFPEKAIDDLTISDMPLDEQMLITEGGIIGAIRDRGFPALAYNLVKAIYEV